MEITMIERARPAWPAKKKTENGEGNRDSELNFCRGKEADTVYSCKSQESIKIAEKSSKQTSR